MVAQTVHAMLLQCILTHITEVVVYVFSRTVSIEHGTIRQRKIVIRVTVVDTKEPGCCLVTQLVLCEDDNVQLMSTNGHH